MPPYRPHAGSFWLELRLRHESGDQADRTDRVRFERGIVVEEVANLTGLDTVTVEKLRQGQP